MAGAPVAAHPEMATKLQPPRPALNRKLQDRLRTLPHVAKPAPTPTPTPTLTLSPPPPPSPSPSPPPSPSPTLSPPPRAVEPSLSDYDFDSLRKSSAPIAERRKRLTKIVASMVGVAWFICLVAVGETALRSVVTSARHREPDARASVARAR